MDMLGSKGMLYSFPVTHQQGNHGTVRDHLQEGYKKKTHHGVRCQREVAQSLYSPVDSPEKTSGKL